MTENGTIIHSYDAVYLLRSSADYRSLRRSRTTTSAVFIARPPPSTHVEWFDAFLLLFLCVLLGRDRGKHSQFSVATSKRYAFLGAERCSHLRVSSPGIVNIIMPEKPFCLDAANVCSCAVCVCVCFTWAHLNVLLIYVISQLGSCITLDRYGMILVMSPGLRQMEL